MSVVLHLSDTHFGTERPEVVEAVVALAVQQQPDVLVLSGDITQRARPEQFRAAKAFVDRLGGHLVAIPGNHDIPLFDWWSRATRPYAGFLAEFGPELEPVFRTEDVLVIGVNTTRARRHRHGEVSAAQVDRVSRLLAMASHRQLRVVVVHQPAAVATPGERHNLLRGHAYALRAWAAAGADVVLGGHIHLPFVLHRHEGGRRLWVVQAGTAVSARTRSGVPNSVNLFRWGEAVARSPQAAGVQPTLAEHCLIERWDYDAQLRAFVLADASTVKPDRP
ncbi:MAG TPA: metallophosphoesterase family protein [Burkholderiaceae bacterium]|nr:metallophosphoesterase family protein [Burkholderiaceae bacterium]